LGPADDTSHKPQQTEPRPAEPPTPAERLPEADAKGAQSGDLTPLDVEQGSAGRPPDATHGLLTPLPNTGHIRRDLAQVRAAFRMQSLRR